MNEKNILVRAFRPDIHSMNVLIEKKHTRTSEIAVITAGVKLEDHVNWVIGSVEPYLSKHGYIDVIAQIVISEAEIMSFLSSVWHAYQEDERRIAIIHDLINSESGATNDGSIQADILVSISQDIFSQLSQ